MFGLELITPIMMLVSATVAFAIGFLWYSPALFGARWAELVNVKFDDNASMLPCMLAAFGIALLQAFGIAWMMQVTGALTLVAAFKLVSMITFVFVGSMMINFHLWEKRSWELIVINLGHLFVSLTAIAAVFIYMIG